MKLTDQVRPEGTRADERAPLNLRNWTRESFDTPPTECRLLRLAGELRNRIYTLAVLEDAPVAVKYTRDRHEQENWYIFSTLQCRYPSLAATSQQVRQEVLPIHFSENVFRFQSELEERYFQEPWYGPIQIHLRHIRHVLLSNLYLYLDVDDQDPTLCEIQASLKPDVDSETVLIGGMGLEEACLCKYSECADSFKSNSRSYGSNGELLLDLLLAFDRVWLPYGVCLKCKKGKIVDDD